MIFTFEVNGANSHEPDNWLDQQSLLGKTTSTKSLPNTKDVCPIIFDNFSPFTNIFDQLKFSFICKLECKLIVLDDSREPFIFTWIEMSILEIKRSHCLS